MKKAIIYLYHMISNNALPVLVGLMIGLCVGMISVDINKPIVQNVKDEAVLTKWVYEHSDFISIDTAREIVRYSMQTKNPLLTIALIHVESEFKPTAISRAGAIGLTQVMFRYHGDMLIKAGIIKERRDLLNVRNSIQAGDAVLGMYMKETKGDVEKALHKYLGGRDGFYVNKIAKTVMTLYVLTQLQG